MSEHDFDRMVKVRASVIEDGERRIRELEAELAKCAFHRHIEELEEDAQKFHDDMEKYKAEAAHLRACLKRVEWVQIPTVPMLVRSRRCPVCWCSPKEIGGDGHRSKDCWLAKELEGK